ncbi:hypothetical protein ILUMI_04301 [Ignelater luminosus]|uniref:Uncharacterized protein n=1 Tax=Ignelater luminosus TaxID=2038154 RepID=A0A8K0DD43_IGNLU|nr:hypothetical protein ILUMI_04301 [Ignelater luminosus]
MANLTVVGCDGTPTNTGVNNGVIPLLENVLGKLLQWLVCLSKRNELPSFQVFDGGNNLPAMDLKNDLNTDKKYLFEMAKAIPDRSYCSDLSIKKPEKLTH